jgi:hypothetical protein
MQATTQLPSFAAPGARQRPCFTSSARSARDLKVGLILLETLNREEGNSSTGPSFDFPPSRRARNKDPTLHLPPQPPHRFSSCGRTAPFALGWAVDSEVSCHCKRFVRALRALALLIRHRSTPSPRPLGYAVAARLPISCLCNDLKTARHHVRSLDSFWSTRSHRAKRALVLAHAHLVMRTLRCCTASPLKAPPTPTVQLPQPALFMCPSFTLPSSPPETLRARPSP